MHIILSAICSYRFLHLSLCINNVLFCDEVEFITKLWLSISVEYDFEVSIGNMKCDILRMHYFVWSGIIS